MTARPTFPRRLARAVLPLFPRAFVAEFGDEFVAFVEALAADESRARGRFARTRLALHVLRDALPAALAAHARAAAAPTPSPAPSRAPAEDRMDTLLQDLRFAARSLVRRPAFAAVAIVTLMLGIGANTAIFSIVDAVLLRPLPYPAPERIAVLWAANKTQGPVLVSVPDFLEWRARNHSFADIGIERTQSVNLTGVDKPDRLIGNFVDSHTLRILGARTELGRLFADRETAIGTGAPVAVLSDAVWRGRFGGDPSIVGRTLTLNGQPFVVIGVLAPSFVDPYPDVEVYLPITSPPSPSWLTRDNPEVWAVGRLRAGVTMEAARRELSAIMAELAKEYPLTTPATTVFVQSLRDSLVGRTRVFLLITLAAVGFVLLIACANVANLLLARATARRREISVRAALGAGRSRLVRQLLTESLVLSVVGGVAGVVAARWGIVALVAASPGGLPIRTEAGLEPRVLLFSLVVTVGAGLFFGAAPAAFAARANLNDALGARVGDGGRGGRFDVRSAFVAVQLALCIVLLVGAGLLVRSLQKLTSVDIGFDPDRVITAEFRLPVTKYRNTEQIAQFMSAALDEIRRTPGIRSAALAGAVPMSGNWSAGSYLADNAVGGDAEHAPVTQMNIVSDGFFSTMRIPLLRGRDFDPRDRADALGVAIVSERFARTAWPNESPIGHRVHVLGPPDRWVTVVGEVGDIKQVTIGEVPQPQLYAPVLQNATIFNSVVARTAGDPDSMSNALRGAIWRVDADQPVWKVRSLDYLVHRDVAPARFNTMLIGGFALLALILASVGVYGVMSYVVAQRTREVGIRIALGARGGEVVRLVVGRGVRVVGVATVIGLGGAYGMARVMSSQLFGVSTADPIAFTLAPAVLVVVALLACWIPARRAARVDPTVALRSEG